MKMIIAVFFFGIVACAFAPDSPGMATCLEETPTPNLVYSTFFSGTWYVTQAKKISTSVCHQFSSTIADTTISVTADGYYAIGKKRSFYNVRCSGTKESESGKFSLTCKLERPDSTTRNTISVQVEVTVMETDNNKYAVLYRCATSGSHKDDNYLVLQRNENEEISDLKNILKRKGLSNLISRKKSTHVCPPAQ